MGLFRKRHNQYEIGNWYVGWKSWKFDITYCTHGYESDNAELHISMFGWHSLFRLPWKHKHTDLFYGEKKYGVAIFETTIFWYWGYDIKCWELPFISYGTAVRWERYIGPPNMYFFSAPNKECWGVHPYKTNYEGGCHNPTTWEYDYKDPYDGKIVPCKFWVEEMEWRPKWLGWTSLFAKTRRYIEVSFSEEMGPRKGSWKGGTIGCGFNLNPKEHPMDCIKRMEREYKFV